MKQIVVRPILSDEEIKSLEGSFISEKFIRHPLITDDTIVKDHTGRLILVFKKNAIPQHVVDNARNSFRKAVRSGSNNRGMASGNVSDLYKVGDKIGSRTIGKVSKNRWYPLLPNGTLSKTSYGINVLSSTIGFNDRYPRIPYCRTSVFTQRNLPAYHKTLPYILWIDKVYQEYAPHHHKLQKKITDATSQDFVIKGSAFTTVTVNRNYRTACHYDKGDYAKGFGNLGVLRLGPKYGIGIDLSDSDVSLFDVHELHGNTELKRIGYSERISIVCYYRESMIYCGDSTYELERAKKGLKTKYTMEEKERVDKLLQEINA